MATGASAARANAAIDAAVALGTWIKLHVGDPGAAGTANAAVETTRKQATFGAASAGVAVTTADLTWTSIAGSEDATHFSMWTASTAGTFLWSGTITANAYTAGDTYTATTGNVSLSISIAA